MPFTRKLLCVHLYMRLKNIKNSPVRLTAFSFAIKFILLLEHVMFLRHCNHKMVLSAFTVRVPRERKKLFSKFNAYYSA